MKKIPTLFERVYEGHKIVDIKNVITPGCEEALVRGIPTVKYDGSCCAIINGQFYKRYDCKKGKIPPKGAIACCNPDPITGHWPHLVKVDENNPSDKWFIEAYNNSVKDGAKLVDGTYEAVGQHFLGNPYKVSYDILIPHGKDAIEKLPRSFEFIRHYLEHTPIEGIVFWLDGEPICKIKRTDFGFEWPIRSTELRDGHEYI